MNNPIKELGEVNIISAEKANEITLMKEKEVLANDAMWEEYVFTRIMKGVNEQAIAGRRHSFITEVVRFHGLTQKTIDRLTELGYYFEEVTETNSKGDVRNYAYGTINW